ncbi:MAG: hypothetical protein LBR39_02440, partial [Coriobacteriales bacterium]|nr:hypothetical protein [Coriobacteriales bacterium]
MRIKLAHSFPGRLRVRTAGRIPDMDAVALELYVASLPGVRSCTVYGRTGSIAISYVCDASDNSG